MIGGVTHYMLPHTSGIPHLHVNRPLDSTTKPLLVSQVFDQRFLHRPLWCWDQSENKSWTHG